jgi:hypothetical protein
MRAAPAESGRERNDGFWDRDAGKLPFAGLVWRPWLLGRTLFEGLRANTHNCAAYLASRLLVAEEWAGRRAFAMTQ